MTFQVGEKVVYPNHGVGTIENISSRSFGTQSEKFYLLRLSYNSLTVMVPFSHVSHVGLRKVTRNGEVSKMLDFLAAQSLVIFSLKFQSGFDITNIANFLVNFRIGKNCFL